MQEEERLTGRIIFHVKPSIEERVERAVENGPFDKPDWLRHWLEDTLERVEASPEDSLAAMDVEPADASLAVQLAAAQAQVEGQERIIQMLREQIGQKDAHSTDLVQQINGLIAKIENPTPALPAPQGAGHTRRSWQFWRR